MVCRWVTRYNGYYYLTFTNGDNITIYQSKSLTYVSIEAPSTTTVLIAELATGTMLLSRPLLFHRRA